MKLRTFVILLVICGILGGAAYFMSGSDNQSEDKQLKMGENLLGKLPVKDIASITIKSNEDSVALKKGDPVWVIENRFNYPANFSMISDLVEKVKETKIGRSFKASDEILSNLSLHSPDQEGAEDDQKGVRITIEDNAKKVLADIIIGGTRESSSGKGGHYVMLVKSPTIYLVDKNYRYVDEKPSEWLDKDLLKVDENDIEKVVCFDPKADKTVYTLKRPEKGSPPEFVDLPSDKKAKKAGVNKVVKAISSFKIEDISDPLSSLKDSAFENALCFEYYLFDGTVYKVYPGNAQEQDDTKHLFKAEVSYTEPVKEGKKEDAGDAESKEEEPQKSPDELSAEAEKLNNKIAPWVYVVPKWRYDNFITDPGQFYEDKEVKKEPKPDVSEVPEIKPEEPEPEPEEAEPEEAEPEEEPVIEKEPEAGDEETEAKKEPGTEEAEADSEEAETETEEAEVKKEEPVTEEVEASTEEAEAETDTEEQETEEVEADSEEAEAETEGEEEEEAVDEE